LPVFKKLSGKLVVLRDLGRIADNVWQNQCWSTEVYIGNFLIQLLLHTLQKINRSRKILVVSKARVFADTRILRGKMPGVDHLAAMRGIA